MFQLYFLTKRVVEINKLNLCVLLYFPSMLTQALLLTPSCSFLHHDAMLSGKGSRYETFPYCTLQLGYSQPHNLDHAMNVVPQPHPASGSCREGSMRNLPKVFVIPLFSQPHRNPVQRLSHPFSLPLPPKYSLKPPQRLLSWQRSTLLGVLLTTLYFLPPGPEASIHYGKQQG